MLKESKKLEELKSAVKSGMDTYCSGLHLSARWFVLSSLGQNSMNVVMLPDRESAEYCACDLYGLTEGDSVFFLPDSAVNLQKSNFKATVEVQRTSALSAISGYNGKCPLYIVTYPEAIEEGVPLKKEMSSSLLKLEKGTERSHTEISGILASGGFEKVDFVASPGQFAIRGGIIDVFSYGFNHPYRISFFGND